jgi:predicted nucleic acid-binding protein
MSYLLDTCVLSELRKFVPPKVVKWFENRNQDLFYISVVSIAEILDGIERLPNSKKRRDLEDWFYGEVHSRFKDRILPIEDHIAKEWACLNASLQKKGLNIGVQDLYLAATARAYGFSLVTLNTKDFRGIDLLLSNPWL